MEPNEPSADAVANLLEGATAVVPSWFGRIVVVAARRGGFDPDEPSRRAALAAAVPGWSEDLLAQLERFLALDVDRQRTNPLALFRSAVAAPTELLRSWDVPLPPVDAFTSDHFPDDVYGLGPATWSDVDEGLHELGLMWSAWKAMTVLRRRRDEGLR